MSGCTAVTVFILNEKIICANAGDSRAIILEYSNNGTENAKNKSLYTPVNKTTQNGWKVKPISRDHKPELHDEKMRILSLNGTVEKINCN